MPSRLLTPSLTLQCITCTICKSTPVAACTPQYSVDSVRSERSTDDKTRNESRSRNDWPEPSLTLTYRDPLKGGLRSGIIKVKTTSRPSRQHFILHVVLTYACSCEANWNRCVTRGGDDKAERSSSPRRDLVGGRIRLVDKTSLQLHFAKRRLHMLAWATARDPECSGQKQREVWLPMLTAEINDARVDYYSRDSWASHCVDTQYRVDKRLASMS